ncbi:MAG: efflux RND transporter permease subunit [Gemmatimonadota bacterium]|nr:MAG: efflux RND transporter permease subunit [Gemmatimonadota bacterium]
MIRMSINRPTTVAMIYVAIAAVGVASFLDIPVELLPDVEYPELSINTDWPGASPEVVEAFLTAPLESATQQVRGVHKIESESSEGRSEITVEFARGTDMDFARLELGERIQSIRDDLPPDVRPQITLYIPREFQTGERVDMRYTLSGSYTFERLRRYAEDELRPQLIAVDGIEEVAVWGGEDREIRIELDRGRMEAFGVRPYEVAQALGAAELIRTAGKLRRENTEWVVTIRNDVGAAAELGSLIVVPDTLGTGDVVRVSDIASIHDTTADPAQYFRIDGRPAIMIALVRGVGTNALRVADAVKAKIDQMREELLPGTWLTLEYDGSREIERQLTDLRLRALAAAIVIFLVLLLFLGSFRTAGIVFATVVFSVLIAVNLLYFGKFSLNVLTMAGLAMGFGLMVDNSIVVLENIYRRRRAGGEQSREAAEKGTRQVALPIVAGTLTTVIVFLPFLYLQGELRLYYLPFAYAVGFSLLASLFVAFTFVPGLAARALAGQGPGVRASEKPPFYVRIYRGVLSFALDHPVIVILVTAAAFAGSYRLFDEHVVKGAIWGRGWGQQTYIQIIFNMPRGAELSRTDQLVREFEAKLATVPEIERFTANVMPERAYMRVTFPDSLENTYVPVGIKEQMVAYSYLFAGAEVRVYGFGPSFYGGGSSPPTYTIKLLGYNYEIVRDIAEDLARRLRRFNRVREVDTNVSSWWWTDKAFEFFLSVDRLRLAGYGLSVEELLRFVASNVQGQVSLNRIKVGGEEVVYSVKLEGYREFDFADLRDLLVPTTTGESVRLSDVAQVGRREVLNRIVRENQQYQRLVGWEFRGPRRLGDRVRDVAVDVTELPAGYSIEKERDIFWTDEEQRQIYTVLVFAVILIYIVTAALFESLRAPFVVLLTVPLALIGVFLIFFYTNASFTRSAYIGVIMMAGIVVNNAILVVYHINEIRRAGVGLKEAIIQGTLERVRPILMTTLTTVVGLLPLILFSETIDATIWNALALATIGGLIASTIFVLTSIPVLYYLFERPAVRAAVVHAPAAAAGD